jgi:hypothetical protein
VLGAPDVAIISAAFHRRAFDAAPDVIGKTIELDGLSHTIIGVAPPILEREHRIGDLKNDEGESRDVWVPSGSRPSSSTHARAVDATSPSSLA